MSATRRGVSGTLGVAVVIVAVLMTTLVAPASTFLAAALTIFTVAAIARMEGDNLLGGSGLGHDRGRARAKIGHGRRWVFRSSELNDQRRFGRVIRGHPGHVAIARRSSDDK